MISTSDVKWGNYSKYEGAYFHGSKKFKLPQNPSNAFRTLDVITSTEGGAPDGVNAYDRCIISVGYLQWCEAAYYLSSKLLGHIASKNFDLLDPMKPALEMSNAEFKKDAKGRWRFHFKNPYLGVVDEKQEQKKLFLLNSSGHKGSWDEPSKQHVKNWVVCMANTLAQDEADKLQIEYTASRLMWFVTSDAKSILWGENLPNEGWVGALRAGFLSFAANLPATADKHLKIAISTTDAAKWSKDWCVHVLKELTFGPKISIYPGRYDKIFKPIERNYGVDLPDFSSELRKWEQEFDNEIGDVGKDEPSLYDLREIQQILLDMGYDLGPAKVDGRMGEKTETAIRTFQSTHFIPDTGVVDPKTRAALLEAKRQQICI